MPTKRQKGSAFEREFCGHLSRWWTNGADDAVFWRTAGSGGRSTVRSRSGKRTANQAGDVCAIDPIGQPLIDKVTFELKRGYSHASLQDLIDRPVHAALQPMEQWIAQATASATRASTPHWAIVHKRNVRNAIIIFSGSMAPIFEDYDATKLTPRTFHAKLWVPLRPRKGDPMAYQQLFVLPLAEFFAVCRSDVFRGPANGD